MLNKALLSKRFKQISVLGASALMLASIGAGLQPNIQASHVSEAQEIRTISSTSHISRSKLVKFNKMAKHAFSDYADYSQFMSDLKTAPSINGKGATTSQLLAFSNRLKSDLVDAKQSDPIVKKTEANLNKVQLGLRLENVVAPNKRFNKATIENKLTNMGYGKYNGYVTAIAKYQAGSKVKRHTKKATKRVKKSHKRHVSRKANKQNKRARRNHKKHARKGKRSKRSKRAKRSKRHLMRL